jgi:DNA-binding NtrC family response regulator
VEDASKGEEALERLRHESYDLVITDLRMGRMGGMDVLKDAKARNPRCAVMIVTAYASIESAAEAMKSGADDYLAKPFSLIELEHRVAALLDKCRWSEERDLARARRAEGNCYVWPSAAMGGLKQRMAQVAESGLNVLIESEPGCCEEELAWAIHDSSARKPRPFVALRCGTLDEGAFAAALLGHERGAYSGSSALRRGGLELAEGGTLYLGQVGELSMPSQGKLLKALEQKGFERLGGSTLIRCDVRIVSSSHRDLKALVQDGRFRDDLYFRLAGSKLDPPPLRQLGDELMILAERFLRLTEAGKPLRLGGDAESLLLNYGWPGNLEELKSVIERAVLLSPGEILRLDLAMQAPAPSPSVPSGKNLAELMDDAEKALVVEALKRSGNNLSQAAKLLGIERSTLQYKVKKFGLA